MPPFDCAQDSISILDLQVGKFIHRSRQAQVEEFAKLLNPLRSVILKT